MRFSATHGLAAPGLRTIATGGIPMADHRPRSPWLVSPRAAVSAWILMAAVATGFPAPARPMDATAAADDRALSAGIWTVAAVEWDGKPVDPELIKLLQVHFRADGSWAVLFRNRPVAEGRSTHRQDTSPKTFEMETLGSERIEPSRYTGIYRLDGDKSTLCIAPAARPRPDDFTAPKRSGRMLVTLERLRR
jgi:uncharacterized protein (TIGR03067 family)